MSGLGGLAEVSPWPGLVPARASHLRPAPVALVPAGKVPLPPAPPAPAGLVPPTTVAEALAMAEAGLAYLAGADLASLPAAGQAEVLESLGRSEALHTAAQARALAAFSGCRGFEADGLGSARSWLVARTRITRGAAGAATRWARRLAAHPAIRAALAAGDLSTSWAQALCVWTELLPESARGDAEVILVGAAAGGAELGDLGAVAEEIRRRTAAPDADGDGFPDRWVRLERTLGGAGRLAGDLTPACAAALAAVLGSLNGRGGPADERTVAQREHDALEEACRRLAGARCLPARAGQAVQVQLHMTLDQLRDLPGAPAAEAAWAIASPEPAAPPGTECDATIVPIVSGHLDHALLTELARAISTRAGPARGSPAGHPPASPGPAPSPALVLAPGPAQARLREVIARHAADLLSGPAGLAAWLRTGLLAGPPASISLPLDTGKPTETIPPHVRRAVTGRDRRCAFPGCQQPPPACQVHHLVPRSEGGNTDLANLILLCPFHHLTVIHRWGWTITLHPDGTTTAVSPDHTRTLHSHTSPALAKAPP